MSLKKKKKERKEKKKKKGRGKNVYKIKMHKISNSMSHELNRHTT